jgi:hypothetical protein
VIGIHGFTVAELRRVLVVIDVLRLCGRNSADAQDALNAPMLESHRYAYGALSASSASLALAYGSGVREIPHFANSCFRYAPKHNYSRNRPFREQVLVLRFRHESKPSAETRTLKPKP